MWTRKAALVKLGRQLVESGSARWFRSRCFQPDQPTRRLVQRSAASRGFPDGLHRKCKHATVRRILLPVLRLDVPPPQNLFVLPSKSNSGSAAAGNSARQLWRDEPKKTNDKHTTVVFVLRLFCDNWLGCSEQNCGNFGNVCCHHTQRLRTNTLLVMTNNNNNNIKLMKLQRRKHRATRRRQDATGSRKNVVFTLVQC